METMTSKNVQDREFARRSWNAFELLLLAPFALLVWYIATQPLVVPVNKEVGSPAVTDVAPIPLQETSSATQPEKQLVEQPTTSTTSLAEVQVVFVRKGLTSVLQRIAPVASVNLEIVEMAIAAETAPIATGSDENVALVEHSASITPLALRIAISDGTGVEGFATAVAEQLEQAGVMISATATVAGTQKRNVILFRDGFEEDAVRLSKLFARPPALVNITKTSGSSNTPDVRLVLGSAATREKALLARKTAALKL